MGRTRLSSHRAQLLLESVEKVVAVMGARCGFGMVLNAECVFLPMAYTRNRVIVQVAMGHNETIRQRFLLHREAMVLSGDFDLARF